MNPAQDNMKDIECPVCLELMVPPILQCENGHALCSACRTKVFSCPVCKGKLINTRKYDLENFSHNSKHPCKFHGSGCTEKHLLAWRQSHESQCLYRYRICPLGYHLCNAKVDPKNCKDHILKVHKDRIQEVSLDGIHPFTRFSEHPKIINSTQWYDPEVWLAGDYMFIVCMVFSGNNIKAFDKYVYCAHVGSPEEAGRFKYTVVMNSQKRCLTTMYATQCLSYLEIIQRGMNKDTCVYLQNDLITECTAPTGKISCEFKISKVRV